MVSELYFSFLVFFEFLCGLGTLYSLLEYVSKYFAIIVSKNTVSLKRSQRLSSRGKMNFFKHFSQFYAKLWWTSDLYGWMGPTESSEF
jgi:hypothetical protein